MQKIIFFLVLVVFIFGMGCSGGEGPLTLPAESQALAKTVMEHSQANDRNRQGILFYEEEQYMGARALFREAYGFLPEMGEIYFNRALTSDKIGLRRDAFRHFKLAHKYANGNALILESKILLAYMPCVKIDLSPERTFGSRHPHASTKIAKVTCLLL